jgi:RNA polymerase sigma-70 factor, ECF subfamily
MTEFARLLEAQLPRLRRYARALTRDPSRADDLIQDTLVRALAKQHLYQDGTNLRAWLFTLMHNQHVNDVRRNVREGDSLDVDTVAAHLVAVTDPTASRQLRELDEAIGKLAMEQRQVILLIGLEGMSYEETAAILSAGRDRALALVARQGGVAAADGNGRGRGKVGNRGISSETAALVLIAKLRHQVRVPYRSETQVP